MTIINRKRRGLEDQTMSHKIVFVLPDGTLQQSNYINCLSGSYPYDGHWPLTPDEQLTLKVQAWLLHNKSRYYATASMDIRGEGGAKVNPSTVDFIVLLSACLKEW